MKGDASERLDNLEDEVQALDSTIDARTKTLWSEITKLRAIIEELKAAQTRREK